MQLQGISTAISLEKSKWPIFGFHLTALDLYLRYKGLDSEPNLMVVSIITCLMFYNIPTEYTFTIDQGSL